MNSVNQYRVLNQNSCALRCSIPVFNILVCFIIHLIQNKYPKTNIVEFSFYLHVYLTLNYNRYSFSLNFNDEGIFFYTHYERNAEQQIYHVYNARFFFLMHEYGRSAFNEFEKAFVRERQTSINGNLIVRYQQISTQWHGDNHSLFFIHKYKHNIVEIESDSTVFTKTV